jgi:hypothetical protein
MLQGHEKSDYLGMGNPSNTPPLPSNGDRLSLAKILAVIDEHENCESALHEIQRIVYAPSTNLRKLDPRFASSSLTAFSVTRMDPMVSPPIGYNNVRGAFLINSLTYDSIRSGQGQDLYQQEVAESG